MRDSIDFQVANDRHAFREQYSEKLRFESLGKLVNNYLKEHSQPKPLPASTHTVFSNKNINETQESFVNVYSTRKTLITLYRDVLRSEKSDSDGPYRCFTRGILRVRIDSDDLNEVNTIHTDLDEIVRPYRKLP